jgi:hypothetical protein
MWNWKHHLEHLLEGLANTHADAPLDEIQRILCGVLHVSRCRFQDRDGRELAGHLPLHKALPQIADVALAVPLSRHSAGQPGSEDRSAARNEPSRFREGPPAEPAGEVDEDERFTNFLREFLRLERKHDFMWAGYIVRELLPRLGFAPEEAKVVLDRLRSENLVTITKVPNPKNPDFPATGVQVNRDHPRVQQLLSQGVEERAAQDYAPAERQ